MPRARETHVPHAGDINPVQPPQDGESPAPVEQAAASWRTAWQIPAIGAGLIAATLAIVHGVRTAPSPQVEPWLEQATRLTEQHRHEQALGVLNAAALPIIAQGHATQQQRARFHVLRARAMFLGQEQLGISREENYRAILREYREASEASAHFNATDTYYIGRCALELGDWERVHDSLATLGSTHEAKSLDLTRRTVEASMNARPARLREALDLLTLLSADPELDTDNRVWVLRNQTVVLLEEGFADEAVTRILRAMPRLQHAQPAALGEVLLSLAEAYMRLDEPQRAAEQLTRAANLLPEGHQARPHLLLLEAEVDRREGNLRSAQERFAQVLSDYAGDARACIAMLGHAEVLALRASRNEVSSPDEAVEQYSELVERLVSPRPPREPTPARVISSMLSQTGDRLERHEYLAALRLAESARRLAEHTDPLGGAPADVLHAIARARSGLALELIKGPDGQPLPLSALDPSTQQEARRHLIAAAEVYRLHASRIAASDGPGYLDSLWAAGDAFDRAGDLRSCVRTFQQFLADAPADARRAQAAYRLAQAFRAMGDFGSAEQLFRGLIAQREESSGPLADAAYVPLAQTLLADGKPENDAEAEELLSQVLAGATGGVKTHSYRAALLEMAGYQFSRGNYERTIERLEEYLGRSPELQPHERADAQYQLAESYKRSAEGIRESFKGAMPDQQRRDLERVQAQRLARATDLYLEVRDALLSMERRSGHQDLRLRNACLALGDCAMESRDFDNAIRFYDSARERFPRDPAILVAMVQIVRALLEQGRIAEAATANERARRMYESLPDSVWDDPMLPMTRQQWEAWLAAQSSLAAAAADGQPSD